MIELDLGRIEESLPHLAAAEELEEFADWGLDLRKMLRDAGKDTFARNNILYSVINLVRRSKHEIMRYNGEMPREDGTHYQPEDVLKYLLNSGDGGFYDDPGFILRKKEDLDVAEVGFNKMITGKLKNKAIRNQLINYGEWLAGNFMNAALDKRYYAKEQISSSASISE